MMAGRDHDRPFGDTPDATAKLLQTWGFDYENTGGGIWLWRRRMGDTATGPEWTIQGVGESDDPGALQEPALISLWDDASGTGAKFVAQRLRDFLINFETWGGV